MEFNLFQWVREGVRQSVLLGVSDAMQQIGTPDQDTPMHESLQQALRSTPDTPRKVGANAGRRRLGKSLRDLGGAASK